MIYLQIPKKNAIQDVDETSIKQISHENAESNWIAPNGPLFDPKSNVDGYFCPESGCRSQPQQKLNDQKKTAREIGEVKTEGKNPKKAPFGRIFES